MQPQCRHALNDVGHRRPPLHPELGSLEAAGIR
jgi:hypothetical protein